MAGSDSRAGTIHLAESHLQRPLYSPGQSLFQAGGFHERGEDVAPVLEDGPAKSFRALYAWPDTDETGAIRRGEKGAGALARTPETTIGHGSSPALDQITRSEEHTSELQSRRDLVCRLLLEKKKKKPE